MDRFTLCKVADLSGSTNNDTITCVSFSRTTNFIAFGGDDKKIDIFRLDNVSTANTINKKNIPIQTLSGNQSAVICNIFSRDETSIYTGSIGGTVKAYDINEGRAYRTFNGHLSSVVSIHSHPYGDFIGTGSVDTSVRVWDIRNKNCVHNYKDHNGSVNCVKFSPDGQCIASSSTDGTIKIYDLVAGKLQHSIQVTDFEGSVNFSSYFEFHPKEFIIAAISGDSTIQLWNIENSIYKMDDLPKEPNRINHVAFTTSFHNNEDLLLSSTMDGIRLWPFDISQKRNAQTADFIECKWGGSVGDIGINKYDQVLVAALSRHTVKIWAINNEYHNNDYIDENSPSKNDLHSPKITKSLKHDLSQYTNGKDRHIIEVNGTHSKLNQDVQNLIQEGIELKQNLSHRLQNLQKMKYSWQKGDVLGCIQMCFDLVSLHYDSHKTASIVESKIIVADFFRSIDIKCQSFMNLNVIYKILPLLEIMTIGTDHAYCENNELENSEMEASYCYKEAAMNILSDILEVFAPFIRNSVHSIKKNNTVLNGGVDLAGEERHQKCLACHHIIQTFVSHFTLKEGKKDGTHEIIIYSSSENDIVQADACLRLRKILKEYANMVADS